MEEEEEEILEQAADRMEEIHEAVEESLELVDRDDLDRAERQLEKVQSYLGRLEYLEEKLSGESKKAVQEAIQASRDGIDHVKSEIKKYRQ